MSIIVITAIFALILTTILGILLCIFRKLFHIEADVLEVLVRETLPGANCGACGFPGCDGFAAAVAARDAAPSLCTVSSAESTKARAKLVGGDAGDIKPLVALVACNGTARREAKARGIYTGSKTCRAAKISAGGTKQCAWGCVGFGDCVSVCAFGAIEMGPDNIPCVNYALCKGCKKCVVECPQGLIKIVPKDTRGPVAFCSNRNTIKAQVRKACKAGCAKCEACVKKCPESAIAMNNGIPEVDYAKCTSCGTCIEICPQKVFSQFTLESCSCG